ncbi:MAG: TIGR04282 family arsenosugar biosynthesis glycosyltransferase [Candidatus Rokubacteria bacterium]|nr:TIGR04282 family arsenosugar biosynthesis glycosyltransferase [Candidatus Rokubacteria bacterium]
MAKVPGATTVKSRLHPSLTPEGATELYRCFLLDRLDALAALPGIAPVIAFTPDEAESAMAALAPPGFALVSQRGGDLGQRLANLLADLIGRGHAAAIAVDSDSPTLPMAYVLEAALTLETKAADVVLGPCDDGGYYLIGVRVPRPGLFQGIPWSTECVTPATLEKARGLGLRVHLLPSWFDVDTEADLRRLHGELAAGHDGPARTRAFVSTMYR